MRLLSLEVRAWRGLEQLALEDLAAGLNVVHGSNESGKSRLFEALHYACFESSRGRAEAKLALQSRNLSAAPEVRLCLESQGITWQLEKRFLRQPQTVLSRPGQVLRDDQAEAQLQELLGVEAPGRTGLKAEGRGLWPLLWLAQGDSRRLPDDDLNSGPRARLQDLLAAEVGEVAAGGLGGNLLQRASAERSRYLTPTGRPTGELRQARTQEAEASERLLQAQRVKQELLAESAELQQLRRRLGELADRESQRSRELEPLRARLEGAESLRAELRHAQLAVRNAEMQHAEHTRQQAEVEQQGERLNNVRLRRRELLSEGQRAAIRMRAMSASLTVASSAHSALAAAHDRALRQAELQHQKRQLLALADRLLRARDAAAQVDAAQMELQPAPSKEDVARLQRMDRELREAEARLEGASAQLEVEALQGVLDLADGPLQAGERRRYRVSEPLVLELPEVARLHVHPGGGQVQQLRDRVTALGQDRDRLLTALAFESFEAAQQAREEQDQAEQEQARNRARLDGLVPEGLPTLEKQVTLLSRELELPASWQPGMPLDGVDESVKGEAAGGLRETEVGAVTQTPGTVEEAGDKNRREPHQLQTELEALRRATTEARLKLEQERSELRQREQEMQRLDSESAALETSITSLPSGEALAQELSRAATAIAEQRQTQQRLEAELGEAGWQELLPQVDALQDAAAREARERNELEAQQQRLAARVELRGDEGLHEREQELSQLARDAHAQLQRVERRATAADHLHSCLERQRRQAQERFALPVRRRIEPQLQRIFPEARLDLDDRWHLSGLRRDQAEEPFDSLSGGAQEQLGLLVRLGLAQILAQGERLPVVLDDPLLHSDGQRQRVLLDILNEAARTVQIVLFTCRGEAWADLAERSYQLPAGHRSP